MDYYYLRNGVEAGPAPIETLIGMQRRGEITEDTPVATSINRDGNGISGWQPLSALLAAARALAAEPAAAERHMGKPAVICLAICGMVAWFFFFCLGLFVSSKGSREALAVGFNWTDFAICAVTYTPTNLALLTSLAAFAGGAGSRLLHWNDKPGPASSDTERYIFLKENPFSSMLRGFAVYLTFLAGVFISTDKPFADPTQEQFVRVAGMVSLLSFFVGYDPTLFKHIASWIPRPKTGGT
jgi:hypothetical protein